MPWRTIWMVIGLAGVAFAAKDVFHDSNHRFQITIPSEYTTISGVATDKVSNSYVPICSRESEVCALYPKLRFARSNFEGAAVEVTVAPKQTKEACYQIANNRVKKADEEIGGRTFVHFEEGDAGMSHRLNQDSYVLFENGDCYNVNARIAFTNYSVYDPGSIPEFTARDQAKVRSELMKIVKSMRLSE